MIPGRLSVVVDAIARRGVVLAARAGHRVLEQLAADSHDPARQATGMSMSRREYLGPYTVPAFDADQLHHGSWELRICTTHGRVSVVRPAGDCPDCDPTPACGVAAGDSPAAVSDGLATTAPAAGHPDPLREATAADLRVAEQLQRLRSSAWGKTGMQPSQPWTK